jgi:hypothetical protein
MAEIPERVARFRASFRAAHIGPRYTGWGHFAFTTSAALATIAFAASRVRAPAAWEWAIVPLGFLVANAAEYFGHKGPMHRRRAGLGALYERHTRQHHQFFSNDAMAYESSRDFKVVLFPPVVILFFLGALATPIGLALGLLVSHNAGWLFAATGTAYFLTYEWLHFAYHQREDSRIGRLGLVRVLRRHHTRHHDPALMGRYNFNITFPICDVLFGTLYRAQPGASPSVAPAREG